MRTRAPAGVVRTVIRPVRATAAGSGWGFAASAAGGVRGAADGSTADGTAAGGAVLIDGTSARPRGRRIGLDLELRSRCRQAPDPRMPSRPDRSHVPTVRASIRLRIRVRCRRPAPAITARPPSATRRGHIDGRGMREVRWVRKGRGVHRIRRARGSRCARTAGFTGLSSVRGVHDGAQRLARARCAAFDPPRRRRDPSATTVRPAR